MKIKDITISIFAIIGFVTILSSFNNQTQETHSTPESHVWELHTLEDAWGAYSINKVTGEVIYLRRADKNLKNPPDYILESHSPIVK